MSYQIMANDLIFHRYSCLYAVHLLNCAIQSYAWGKQGASSEVARLCSSGVDGFSLDEDKPYAEVS